MNHIHFIHLLLDVFSLALALPSSMRPRLQSSIWLFSF
uniref:Uncharacterized protein n=1 Tax=Arundo donax TaxID=35708 RepID=A0A0A9AD78_ARUDO